MGTHKLKQYKFLSDHSHYLDMA